MQLVCILASARRQHLTSLVFLDIRGGKGPISSLFINTIPIPKPTGSQALIRVRRFGLNRMDLLQREGMYPLPPQAPSTMGVEFSGEIISFGGDPERGFSVGDAVFGLAYGGAYAEYIAVSTHMLVHKPEELSWEQCAGIPETWITALQALYLVGEYKPGMSVLWHAGASSVSIAGQQLSKADGAKAVYATARSQDKCDFCEKELGADKAFNAGSDTEPWDEQLLKATNGAGVDLIIDYVGASYFQQNINVAARDCHIVSLAALGGSKLKGGEDIGAFVRKRLRLEGSSLRSRDENYQGKLRDQLVEHALPKLRDGSFQVPIEKVFPWEDIQEAHRLMESNKTKGKLICKIDW
jgi:NADPH:quinone reductase-like Zn-dependent oxidoreductase